MLRRPLGNWSASKKKEEEESKGQRRYQNNLKTHPHSNQSIEDNSDLIHIHCNPNLALCRNCTECLHFEWFSSFCNPKPPTNAHKTGTKTQVHWPRFATFIQHQVFNSVCVGFGHGKDDSSTKERKNTARDE